MNSRSLGATRVFAWPDAEVDVMNPVTAVRLLRRRELAGLSGTVLAEPEAEFPREDAETPGGLGVARAEGYVDEVIEPARTRDAVAAALRSATPTRGRLTNIP